MKIKQWSIALGPALAVVVWLAASLAGLPDAAVWTASVTALCAAWWVTEAIPIPATSLIPFAVFPFLGVVTPVQLASAYGHPLILLLLGGFLLSAAMEHSGAHRRIALTLVRILGGHSGSRLVLGFMITSAVLSMWISNSATTLMLLPVALAVLDSQDSQALKAPLLLGVAYAASIGGLGTPVGTPPNAIFLAIYEEQTDVAMSFLDWMGVGVPCALVFIPVAWFLLTRGLGRGEKLTLPTPGPWQAREIRVLVIFSVTAFLWVFRTAPFGGWSRWLPGSAANDSTVALLAASALFIVPDGAGGRMLTWERAKQIPWGLLLLFSGGIAIAKAFSSSGLSAELASSMAAFANLPEWLMIALLCLSVTFLTELTSNTATATLLMPLLAAVAIGAKLDPKVLMIPAALSASCAFMLPVATAPNAIVFGSGHFTTKDMARAGLRLNLAGTVVLTVICSVLL